MSHLRDNCYQAGTKWTLCFALMLCLLASMAPSLQAQQPCRLECDTITVPFQVHEYITSVSSDCRVKITAAVRGCGGMWEIEIRSITYLDACQGADPVRSRHRATSELVRHNILGLPTHNATWRVAAPACWQMVPTKTLVPCRAECCVSTLRVEQRADCDSWSITAESRSVVRPTCPVRAGHAGELIDDDNPSGECLFSCEPILYSK